MTCTICEMRLAGAIDFNCIGCCVRLLATMPDKDRVISTLLAIERTCSAEHLERVKEAWKSHVAARKG